MEGGIIIKENRVPSALLPLRWLCGCVALSLAMLLLVLAVDMSLPRARSREETPPGEFSGEVAHEYLVNLTKIGPRVAGSYESDVLAVGTLVSALRSLRAGAHAGHRLEIDVRAHSGAFSLDFLDGMTNLYSGVKNVAARLSAAGGPPRDLRAPAVLLNCHFDTVPDSPGASDDAAGCAVLLETLRALLSEPPPPRPVVFLFNGAEENIMQGSHGFVTQHEWASSIRAFINIEACGAGGREVLFQAGPHDPWIVEEYARSVPRPFLSSLAQELFEARAVPADTDFRVLRDHGNLSGVDLAWSSNGYVYHTRLDTPDAAPAASLQRAGDNVRALLRGMLSNPNMDLPVDRSGAKPVFFDVLGMYTVTARPGTAAALTGLALLLLAPLLARAARVQYLMSAREWLKQTVRASLAISAGLAAGLLLAAAAGWALGLTLYPRAWLLAPAVAVPAICTCWLSARALSPRPPPGAAAAGACLLWAALLAACAARGARSGFLPLLALLPPALLTLLPRPARPLKGAVSRGWVCRWALGSLWGALQLWYLCVPALRLLLPLQARGGGRGAVLVGVAGGALTLLPTLWLLPIVMVTDRPQRLIYPVLAVCALITLVAVSTELGAPYREDAPQRLVLLHVRRGNRSEYWAPHLDDNTPPKVPALSAMTPSTEAQCRERAYCGAPYWLPALGVVPAGHWGPAPPARRLLALRGGTRLHTQGPAHRVIIARTVPGAHVSYVSAPWGGAVPVPARGAAAGGRGDGHTYFISLFVADRRPVEIELHVEHSFTTEPPYLLELSVAGHAMAGSGQAGTQAGHGAGHGAGHAGAARTREHEELLASLPGHVAASGWGVDLWHLRV